jgi:hypothetical protein
VVKRPCHGHSSICKTPLKHEWLLKKYENLPHVSEVFPSLQTRPSVQGQLKVTKHNEYPKILKVAEHLGHSDGEVELENMMGKQ